MRIVIDKTDELKLKQLVIAIDAEEFCNGSGRVTINASRITEKARELQKNIYLL